MSDDFCPRQVTFTIPGTPGVEVIATERNGSIHFSVDLQNNATVTGDLRALFFHVNPDKLGGLAISEGGALLTQSRVASDSILDLGKGANIQGIVKSGFDVGIEWGSQGKDGIDYAVEFVLSNAAHNLTLDDIAGQLFGARLDSVSGPGSRGDAALKLTGLAPAAPDARDDSRTLFEDGQKDGLASKSPTGVVLDLLTNDTDGDNQALTITEIHDGPAHGTVTIAADGKSVTYTPALDYAGSDSFVYCVSDGHGGQDSAVVNLTVTAVADNPTFVFSAAQGDDINETILTVTATQTDADGSEYLNNLTWLVGDGLPDGATVVALPGDPLPAEPNAITRQFEITTAAGQDWNFNLLFSAESVERSNGDTQTATATKAIVIDFNSNTLTETFQAEDQSIWSTGGAYTFEYNKFVGIQESLSDSLDILGTGYDFSLSLKAGFGVDIALSAGSIDATIPVDVQIHSTYNKVTDTILLDPSIALGAGAHFQTTGPDGHVNIDSVFSLLGHVFAELVGVDLVDEPIDWSYSNNILQFGSNLANALVYANFNGVISAEAAWPTINVSGAQSGSGESNPFFQMTFDVDDFALTALTGVFNYLDEKENDPDNFEYFDLDMVGGLKLLQDFALGIGAQSIQLRLEDDTVQTLTWGSPMTIANASSHDKNHDGTIDFSFDFAPAVTLNNNTDLGIDLTAHMAVLRNHGLSGLSIPDPLIAETWPLVSGGRIDLYNSTFALGGIQSQNFTFAA